VSTLDPSSWGVERDSITKTNNNHEEQQQPPPVRAAATDLHLLFVVSAVGWQVWQFDNYCSNSGCNAQRTSPWRVSGIRCLPVPHYSGLLVHGLRLRVAHRGSRRQLELHDPQQQQLTITIMMWIIVITMRIIIIWLTLLIR